MFNKKKNHFSLVLSNSGVRNVADSLRTRSSIVRRSVNNLLLRIVLLLLVMVVSAVFNLFSDHLRRRGSLISGDIGFIIEFFDIEVIM
mmetsp:Transcript_14590/g.2117  ORF Transcript_14590/g.2117 Transcript_14590/m.2117 type:complete len:88 (+) Transcript_14590:83-346(+)